MSKPVPFLKEGSLQSALETAKQMFAKSMVTSHIKVGTECSESIDVRVLA